MRPCGRPGRAGALVVAPWMRPRPGGSVRALRPRAISSDAHTRGARPVPIPKDWIKLKKQVLVSVDRAETRVALLEASGTPAALRSSSADRGRSARAAGGRKRPTGRPEPGYRIAE